MIIMASLRFIIGIFFLRFRTRGRNDLYPLPAAALSKQRVNKSVLATIKPSVAR
jgi:hypothetical protein